MKKLLTVILILALAVPAIALADLPDISNLTKDELLELNHQIQLRLFSEQLVNGVDVPAGDYIVGEDIPEGIYRLEIGYPKSGGYLTIYKSTENKIAISESFIGEYWGVIEIGKMELVSGNIVHISGNMLRFFPYTGLFH